MIARYLIATGVSVVFALVLLVIGFMVIVGVSMRPSIEADNNLNHPNDLFARAMTFAHLAACPTDIRNGKIRYIYTGLQQSFDGSFDASPTEVDEWIRQSTSMQSGRTTTYRTVQPSINWHAPSLSQAPSLSRRITLTSPLKCTLTPNFTTFGIGCSS